MLDNIQSNIPINAPLSKEQFEAMIKKIEDLKKTGQIDLSTEEDLSLAVMNLISLEEHFYFTAEKTKKSGYFDLLQEVRSIRKELLGRLINQHEGETWCISKHLLAATMRLIEVGTKLHSDGKKEEAIKMFDSAYKIYTLFWALRLKLVDKADLKKSSVGASQEPWTFEDIMSRLVDCCDERTAEERGLHAD